MNLLCQKCGGPLPPAGAHAAVTCAFCGTTSTPPPQVVAVGRVKPIGAEAATETRLSCPRCADFLTETHVHDSMLSACKSCGGTWLDAATLARLWKGREPDLEAAAARVAARTIDLAPPDLSLSIACPVCRSHLRCVPLQGSGMPVDVCDAHGTWFDRAQGDELGALLQVLRRG